MKANSCQTNDKNEVKEALNIDTDIVEAYTPTIDSSLQKHGIIHISLKHAIDDKLRLNYLMKIKRKYNILSKYIPGLNSLHKYSVDVSSLPIPLKEIKQSCADIIMQQFEMDINRMRLYGGFVIKYSDKFNSSNIKLRKHKDDSLITLNYCFKSECIGNELIFYKQFKNKTRKIPVVTNTGWALIHYGDFVHETLPIESGVRWNLVLWFK
eukprot:406025_1